MAKRSTNVHTMVRWRDALFKESHDDPEQMKYEMMLRSNDECPS